MLVLLDCPGGNFYGTVTHKGRCLLRRAPVPSSSANAALVCLRMRDHLNLTHFGVVWGLKSRCVHGVLL